MVKSFITTAFIACAFALTLTSCGSGSIVSATKSATKYYADRSQKNALDLSKKFAKAEADIRKLDAEAQVNPDKYIKLNEKVEEIQSFTKAMRLLSGGQNRLDLGGQMVEIPDYSELIKRAKSGAIQAYEVRGDKLMHSNYATAYDYEKAMQNYEKAGDQQKAAQAKETLISRLLSDGEIGFQRDLSTYRYEDALNAFSKAASYGSREGEQRYYKLLDAIGLTLVVNTSSISNNVLSRLQNNVPMFVEVVVDEDMRRSLASMRGDLALVMEAKDNRGSEFEIQLIDLRSGRNGTLLAAWPFVVKYPTDRSKYRAAELDAFESAISGRASDISKAIKEKARIVPRSTANYRQYNSGTWRTGSSSGTWRQ